MKRRWDEQELIEHWTLFKSEEALFANRTDRGRSGVAVLLKFFQINARFPRHHKDVPGPVLAFVGEQLSIPPTAWFDYDLKGRSSKRDREHSSERLLEGCRDPRAMGATIPARPRMWS